MRWIFILTLCLLSGCVSPKLREKIDNQNGQIDNLKNNQNGIMSEIGQLKQNSEISNSQLKEVQQGYFNIQNKLSSNDNSGVQILQGDGALFLVFSSVIIITLVYFQYRTKKAEKISNILTKHIAKSSLQLQEEVLQSIANTNIEKDFYRNYKKIKTNL